MSKQIIKQLPEEVINRIAAGEVVERPASAVKELLDNSIDAGANTIQISIKEGGEKLIEVIDDGMGIPEDQIENAFKPHSTSKLTTFEELNDLITLGFRGEALSTIASVSNIELVSKTADSERGYLATIENGVVVNIKPNPREKGTTIRVKELFANIPARAKYMRKPQTEYKYILSVLTTYFLIYPNIRFKLFNDEKLIYDLLPDNTDGIFSEKRIKDTLRSDFTEELIGLYYDGAGMKVKGYIAHPKYHSSRTSHSYLYVNQRPVTDRGAVRAVMLGCGSYIPRGEKLPFMIDLEISPSAVDVNVHPRKEEVRFLNPYRVYSAIEEAVNKAFEKEIGSTTHIDNIMEPQDAALIRFRGSSPGSDIQYEDPNSGNENQDGSLFMNSFDNEPSLDASHLKETDKKPDLLRMDMVIRKLEEDPINVFQIFRKYLFYEFSEELWVMDQHAAAERITFERLKNNMNSQDKEIQELLIPESIDLSKKELLYLDGISSQLEDIGFTIDIGTDSVKVTAIPAHLSRSDLKGLISEIIDDELSEEIPDSTLENTLDDIIATVACHNSIRTEQKLDTEEIRSMLDQLLECNNPYSCPHGRPIIWKLRIDQLDSHFERTY